MVAETTSWIKREQQREFSLVLCFERSGFQEEAFIAATLHWATKSTEYCGRAKLRRDRV